MLISAALAAGLIIFDQHNLKCWTIQLVGFMLVEQKDQFIVDCIPF
jgi:hypothetical protein